jgi:hypothetical protein
MRSIRFCPLFIGAFFILCSQVTFAQIEDIDAKNCEIYVDAIERFDAQVEFKVKVVGKRLIGNLVEVGIYRDFKHTSPYFSSDDRSTHPKSTFWGYSMGTSVMNHFMGGSKDYFVALLPFNDKGDGYAINWEFAFYALTDQGKAYWFKRADDKNFKIDNHFRQRMWRHSGTVRTENTEFNDFNPKNCFDKVEDSPEYESYLDFNFRNQNFY